MKRNFILITVIISSILAMGSFAELDDKKAEAYFSQGYIYYNVAQYNEALGEFIKALQYSPNMVKARYWMAKSYYKLGQYRNVISQCNAGLSIDPKNKDLQTLRTQAERMVAAGAPESPAPKEVKKPEPDPQPIVEKQEPAPTAKKDTKKYISLDLRNVDISTVLEIYSKETGINIISGKDVYGKVTVILDNVTPEDALDMILKNNGYTYTRNGNIVQVFSSGEPARVEELPGGQFVRSFMINYIEPKDLVDTLIKLMPAGSDLYGTKGTKSIIIKGTANDIKRAEILIRNLDIPPRQVMVEARIVEVSLNESQALGVNTSWTNSDNALETGQTVGLAKPATATGAVGLYYNVTNQSATTLVEALSTRTGFNVLSSPRVMAMNEQKAEIITGSRLGYKVRAFTPNKDVIETVEFLDVGTKLVITPSIKSDGLIIMEIHPEISEGSIVNEMPQKNSTETTTKLIVKDGQTIVIGGLIRDTSKKEVKGVPFFMDLPLIGSAFKNTQITTEKKEVIVLITPKIVTPKIVEQMENKNYEMEKQRRDSTPVYHLDLLR